jgi:hypothetical protein
MQCSKRPALDHALDPLCHLIDWNGSLFKRAGYDPWPLELSPSTLRI